MSYLDKFEAFFITKKGNKYKLNHFDSKQINTNGEKQNEQIKDKNKSNINENVDSKKPKKEKKEKQTFLNNFSFLKKLKKFFKNNKKTAFIVKNIKKFVFIVGNYILSNPLQVYNFLFLNKKPILKTNLISLIKIFKLMNKKQKKSICFSAQNKLTQK